MPLHHFITTEDWDKEALLKIVELAGNMKLKRHSSDWSAILKNKTFIMLFYNACILSTAKVIA